MNRNQQSSPSLGSLNALYKQNTHYLNAQKRLNLNTNALPISSAVARLAHLEEAKTTALGFSHLIKYVHRIKNASEEIIEAKASSVFHKREAASSNPDAVSGKAKDQADIQQYTIQIHRLAKAQENTSRTLHKQEPSLIQSGTNQFDVTLGKKTTTLSVFIHPSDTSIQALNKIKNTINNATVGIHAKSIYHKGQETLTLQLSSSQTGENQAFSLMDRVGNAISATGLSYVAQAAQDAAFQINHEPVQSIPINEATLDSGRLKLNFHSETNEPVTIQVMPHANAIRKAVKQLLQVINETHQQMEQSPHLFQPSVYPFLSEGFSSYPLQSIGITLSNNGLWVMDGENFDHALHNQYADVKDTLASDSGWAVHILKQAENWVNQPTSQLMKEGIFTMKRFSLYQPDSQTRAPLSWTGIIMDKDY